MNSVRILRKLWLNSLHDSPYFLKTILFDVKRSKGMITQRIGKITLDIEQGIDTAKSEKNEETKVEDRCYNENGKVKKLEMEAVSAISVVKKEYETESGEKHHFHRGR